MPSFSTVKAAERSLLLKPLDAAIFLADHYTAAPTAYTDVSSALQALPEAFEPVGLIKTKDGVTFGKKVDSERTESYGEAEPTRIDMVSIEHSLEFSPQQVSKTTLELTTRADLSTVTSDTSSGEVRFAEPTSLSVRYYSALAIAKDGDDAEPVFIFRYMPMVALTDTSDQTWDMADTLPPKVTMTPFRDDTAGFAVEHAFGGLGWKNIAVKAGFATATP